MRLEGDRGLAELPSGRQWTSAGDGGSPYCGHSNEDGGDNCIDNTNGSEDGDDWSCAGSEQLEQAALAIQEAWQRHRSMRLEPNEAMSELDVSHCTRRAAEPTNQSASCCIVCFALVPLRSPVLKSTCESTDEGGVGSKQDAQDGGMPLCADCVRRLAASDTALAQPKQTTGTGSVVSAPTRLTHLLRVEAKVNDQLQLLRDQHRILLAQQEQLQATKRAQAEQAAAAKALARERRRHVRMLLERRKREEELRFRQFVDQGEEGGPGSKTPCAAKKLKKKSKTPARAPGSSSISEEATGMPPDPLPPSLPPPIASSTGSNPAERKPEKRANAAQNEIREHTRQLWQRRKQTLDCYSQDLSPLVDGSKPRRLPVPAALLTLASKPGAAKRALPGKQSGSSTASSVIGAAGHSCNQSAKQRRQKKIPSGGVKLRPLLSGSEAGADSSNNQLDELESVHYKSGKSSASPWSVFSPLTAEIKPVSWIHELGRDLRDDEPGLPADCASLNGLHPVVEEAGDFEDDERFGSVPSQARYKHYADLYGPSSGSGGDPGAFTSSAAPTPTSSSASSLFPPLLRQLPPPVAVSPLPSTITSKPQSSAPSTQPSMRWEYSTERLAGLLEKYNVSVKEAVGPGGDRG